MIMGNIGKPMGWSTRFKPIDWLVVNQVQTDRPVNRVQTDHLVNQVQTVWLVNRVQTDWLVNQVQMSERTNCYYVIQFALLQSFHDQYILWKLYMTLSVKLADGSQYEYLCY